MKKYKLETGSGVAPLYAQLKEVLLKEIKAGVYKRNDTIPTEQELQDMFDVSRMTVRLAVNELASEGYVVRERAKGTRVIYPKIVENLNAISHFNKEMQDKGIDFVIKTIDVSVTKADESVAEALEIPVKSNVFCVHRVYYVEDEPLCSIFTYLPSRINISVEEEIYRGSLYEYLEKEKGITVTKAYEDIEAGNIHKPICKELKLAEGSTVLIRNRKSFDQNDNH
ncbi:MAG: GntR family transcriptional regulator, partial [Longicatena sp.]